MNGGVSDDGAGLIKTFACFSKYDLIGEFLGDTSTLVFMIS